MAASRLTIFWGELRRRKVVRVAIAYGIGAWVLLQIGETLFGLLELPGWVGKGLVVALAIGLPVALILAWIFDISPEGIVAEDEKTETVEHQWSFSDPEPIDVRELVAAPPGLATLIGRQTECDAIRKHLEEALNGQGGIILVGGEPGVGKTRLGEEALEIGRELGLLPLVGHAYEEHGAPFIIATEILEEVARTLPENPLRNVLGRTAPEIARLLPELRHSFPDIPEPMELPPEQQQRYLFNAVLEFLTRLCSSTPVVMLLDDLHWADESSTMLLEHLTPNLPKLPLLMVVTYRDVAADMDEPFKRALAQLPRQPFVSRIPLRHLSHDDIAGLLSSFGGPNPPAEVVDLIYRETEGNAFFVQSVYQHLAEEGRLFDANGKWLTNIDAETLAVPEGVRLVIHRRLERLTEKTQASLTISAILGLRFDTRILASASGNTSGEILDSIEEAEAAKLIMPSAGRSETRYEFAHALVRQTLLESLSSLRRAHLHLEIAEAMEQLFGDSSERAADIARHLYRAGDTADAEKTVRFLKLAADRAVEAAARNEAVGHLEKALTLVPDDQELERAGLLLRCGRLRSSVEVDQASNDLRVALDIYRKFGHSEEIAQIIVRLCFHFTYQGHVEEGLALCKEGLAVVGEEASSARCSILSAMGLHYALAADGINSKRWHEEAQEMAEALDDPELLAEVLANRAVSHWQTFLADGMVRDGGRALELNRAGYRNWELASSLAYYSLGLSMMGRMEEAMAVATECRELSIRGGDSQSQMMCTLALGMLNAASGDLQESITGAQQGVQINDTHGFPWGGHFNGVLADYQMRAGDWDSALESYETSQANTVSGTCWDFGDLSYGLLGMAIIAPERFDAIWDTLRPALVETTTDLPAGRIQTLLAAIEGLATLGRMDEAAEFYPRVLDLAGHRRFVQQFHTGLVEKTVAIGAMAAGDFESAEKHFQTALGQADELPYVTEQGEVRRWYAKMLMARDEAGDVDRARGLLGEAVLVYERCGMPKHRGMAEDALREIGK